MLKHTPRFSDKFDLLIKVQFPYNSDALVKLCDPWKVLSNGKKGSMTKTFKIKMPVVLSKCGVIAVESTFKIYNLKRFFRV